MSRHKNIKKFLILIIIAVFLLFFGYIIVNAALKQYYPLKYKETVFSVSKKYKVEPDIIFAVIHAESKFNEKALSKRGAVGLMQITPDTLDWALQKENDSDADFTHEDLYDPETNIRYGTLILSYHIKEFGDLKTALCAYNAGRSNVKKWLDDKQYSKDGIRIQSIPYKETEQYVERILHAKDIYKWLYDEFKE